MASPVPEPQQFHPVLGRLDYDDETREYAGALTVRGNKIKFHLERDDSGQFNVAERRAVQFARDPLSEIDAVSHFLAGHYLDLANEEWLPPERPRLSVREFIQAIRLEGIKFDGQSGVWFTFADGDIFAGHWLIVRARPDGVLDGHELAG
jgi:hypothetical protein